jgi:hypothetical protein
MAVHLLCFHIPLVVPEGNAADKSRAGAVTRSLDLWRPAGSLRLFLDIPLLPKRF